MAQSRLVQEIYEIYGVSKSLAKTWVEQQQLILLLDGLDEVNTKYRNDCVKALNQFIQTHGLIEIVVCSRIRDYENLSERLKLRSAIYVQSLTSQQINQFLQQAGESLYTLKKFLENNAELQAFASSPLILSIMSLAYQDCSVETLTQVGTPEVQHQQLFDTYINRMLTRRGTTRHYSRQQTLRQLTWLAQKMVQTSQTLFLIERLQPSCLPSRFQIALYRIISIVVICLALGIIYGPVAGMYESTQGLYLRQNLGLIWKLFFLLMPALVGGIAGLVYGLFFGLIDGLFFGLLLNTPGTIKTVEKLKWSWIEAIKSFKNGWTGGYTWTIFVTLISYILTTLIIISGNFDSIDLDSIDLFQEMMPNDMNLISNLLIGIISGLLSGILLGLTLGINILLILEKHIPQIKKIHWFWKTIKFNFIPWLLFGLTGGILWAFGNEFISKFILGTFFGLVSAILNGLFFGLFFGLSSALIGGFKSSEIQKGAIPNQGIRKSIKNSLIFGVTFGLLIGLIIGLNNVENLGISGGILFGILIFGPIGILIGGGSACFRHLTLRIILYSQKYIPWNYARFLDYATERLFMQKVGGGYIFVHRMLLEHFAKMELR